MHDMAGVSSRETSNHLARNGYHRLGFEGPISGNVLRKSDPVEKVHRKKRNTLRIRWPVDIVEAADVRMGNGSGCVQFVAQHFYRRDVSDLMMERLQSHEIELAMIECAVYFPGSALPEIVDNFETVGHLLTALKRMTSGHTFHGRPARIVKIRKQSRLLAQ
jgi:hypothetical protein